MYVNLLGKLYKNVMTSLVNSVNCFYVQALEEEGKNPEEITFDVSEKKVTTPSKKTVGK